MRLCRRVHDVHQTRYAFETIDHVSLEAVNHRVQTVQVDHHRIRRMIHLDRAKMNVVAIYIEATQCRLDRIYLFCDKLCRRFIIAYQVGVEAYQFKYLLRLQ